MQRAHTFKYRIKVKYPNGTVILLNPWNYDWDGGRGEDPRWQTNVNWVDRSNVPEQEDKASLFQLPAAKWSSPTYNTRKEQVAEPGVIPTIISRYLRTNLDPGADNSDSLIGAPYAGDGDDAVFQFIFKGGSTTNTENAQCPAFNTGGFLTVHPGTQCLACWDGINVNGTVGESGAIELALLTGLRENHGYIDPGTQPSGDNNPPTFSDLLFSAARGKIGTDLKAEGANSWTSFLLSRKFQSQWANYGDYVGERCESARSLYYDQNRAPWQSIGYGQDTYGTGCADAPVSTTFTSSIHMPAATKQLLNWAGTSACTIGSTEEMPPPWARPTFFRRRPRAGGAGAWDGAVL